MRSLKDRLTRGEGTSRPTRGVEERPEQAQVTIEKMVRDYFTRMKLTSMSFPGPSGPGVPPGGSPTQILAKTTGRDYETQWVNPPTSSATPPATTNFVVGDPTAAAANTTLFNASVTAAVAAGGGSIVFPSGIIYINGFLLPKFTTNGLLIQGQGIGQTILQQVLEGAGGFPLFRRASVDDPSYASGGRLTFSNFTARGLWQSFQNQSPNERLFNMSGFSYLEFDHVECLDCRGFSISGDDNVELLVHWCRVQRSARDAISFSNCHKTKYVHNTVIDCWDDCLVVHTDNSPATDSIGESHICAHNYVENANGIKYLGANKLQCHDNIILRPHGYGIFWRGESTQGINDSRDVNIHNNQIFDPILSTKFTGGSNSSVDGIYIGSSNSSMNAVVTPGATPGFKIPIRVSARSNNKRSISCTTVNGSGVITGIADTSVLIVGEALLGTGIPSGASIGSIDSSSQITMANGFLATSSTTTTRTFGGNIGGYALRVHDNFVVKRLWNTALYSDWGYNSAPTGNPAMPNDGVGAWTDTGYQNPSMTTNHEKFGNGISMNQAILECEIYNNEVDSFNTGITLSTICTLAQEIRVRGNSVRRVGTTCINLDTGSSIGGSVDVDGNLIDGDPYFEHSNRAGSPLNGAWTVQGNPVYGIDINNFTGPVKVTNNTFKNVSTPTFPLLTIPELVSNNTYYVGLSGKGVGAIFFPGFTDNYVFIDSNPTSSNYGNLLTNAVYRSVDTFAPSVTTRWYPGYAEGPVGPMAVTTTFIYWVPIYCGSPNFDQMSIRVTTAEAGTLCRLGLYAPASGIPHYLVKEFGEVDLSTTGLKTTTALTDAVFLNPGWYWMGALFNANSALRVEGSYFDRSLMQRLLGSGTEPQSWGRALEANFTWDPGNLVAGTGYEDHTGISLPGAALGDRCYYRAPYDTQGCLVTPRVTAADTGAISIFNPTGGGIDLGSGSWALGVDKNDLGDFQLYTSGISYGALPASISSLTRQTAGQSPRIMIRHT